MIGKIYVARVATHDAPFDAAVHAREDLTVFAANISQVRGEAAIIELEAIQPEGGLLAGPRWLILSIEINGAVREIARGKILGYPVGLAGQTVRMQVLCRKDSHSSDVDALFAEYDHLVPVHLEDPGTPRRAERYLLADVHHDPKTLAVTLDPIAGSDDPAVILYGEGAAAGQSEVFGIRLEVTGAPAAAVSIDLEAQFEQLDHGVVDLGDGIDLVGLIDASTGLPERQTLTPIALGESLARTSLSGGYELLAARADCSEVDRIRIQTGERSVDPVTRIVTPASSMAFSKSRIDRLDIRALVSAQQPRRETLTIEVLAGVQDLLGGEREEERTAVLDADNLAAGRFSLSYPEKSGNSVRSRSITRIGRPESVFSQAGQLRDSAAIRAIIDAVARRAARIAIERAHCVRLVIETTAEIALAASLRDRARIHDARLPRGRATGKIIGIEVEIDEGSARGQIILSCPVIAAPTWHPGVLITTEGLEQLVVSDYALRAAPAIGQTPVLAALANRTSSFFIESAELEDGAEAQAQSINPGDPAAALPSTTLQLQLRDLTPVEVDQLVAPEMQLATVTLTLPEGISL